MEDTLSARSISRGIGTRIVGSSVVYYESVSSTNELAHDEIHRNVKEGTVVIAGVQEKGRGRLQRGWETPEGNIALSIILYPPVSRLPYLVMIASLAVCRSIAEVTGLDPVIKWPNDVLIHEKKVCGILIENELRPFGTAAAVVGIGINVGLRPEEYRHIRASATSLERETGRMVSRVDIIRRLLIHIDGLFTGNNDNQTFREWRDKLITLGKPVTATWKNRKLEGIAESVDESGALNIRLADGNLYTVVAGDVTLRKNP